MLKNKKFARYAIAFCILGVVWMFFYSGLQNDQINIIQGFSGWSNAQTLAPMTVGNLVCIVLTMVYGTCLLHQVWRPQDPDSLHHPVRSGLRRHRCR